MRTITKPDMAEWLAADQLLRNGSPGSASSALTKSRKGEAVGLSIRAIDPLSDQRWEQFVENHPRSSIFHTQAWLEALRRTYGYTPVVYTTTTPRETALRNGVLFCEVNSWLTGKRLVSLPFSDHCEPLIDQADELQEIYTDLERLVHSRYWRYIEMRPIRTLELSPSVFHSTLRYYFHQLDLTPDLDSIYKSFHKNSIQRKIKRAEREGLIYWEDSNLELLDPFYRLFSVTRQRHKIPPPPLSWFRNLIETLGERLKIRMAFKGDHPVAGMVTIRHRGTFVYKYGCSDARFHSLGGMPMLYWKSIREAKTTGCRIFDFGRCDFDQAGLIIFKRRWGAAESVLTYSRYANQDNTAMHFPPEEASLKMKLAKELFAHLPVKCLSFVGNILYKHVG
ncbi:MAG TPA: GNAT family N-acetyltransferase [Candidatus Acidoferrum sp.]|jgi:hypothetical protein